MAVPAGTAAPCRQTNALTCLGTMPKGSIHAPAHYFLVFEQCPSFPVLSQTSEMKVNIDVAACRKGQSINSTHVASQP